MHQKKNTTCKLNYNFLTFQQVKHVASHETKSFFIAEVERIGKNFIPFERPGSCEQYYFDGKNVFVFNPFPPYGDMWQKTNVFPPNDVWVEAKKEKENWLEQVEEPYHEYFDLAYN